MADKHLMLSRLDDPELIGLWTLDEFLAMIIPFAWGILTQHILPGLALAFICWLAIKRAKGGRQIGWIVQACYWYAPSSAMGWKALPPSHCRLLAG